MALSTVSGILARIGMGKLGRLGLEPAQRYEREHPGELIHIDVKKLGRIQGGAGHRITGQRGTPATALMPPGIGVAIPAGSTSTSRSMTPPASPTPRSSPTREVSTAVGFLRRAIAFYQRHGITVQDLLTDNGGAYISTVHAVACRALGIRHLRTRPRRPQTNGKAERFIRTLLGGWAYGAIYRDSAERTAALDGWLWHYNHHRRHSALGHNPPITERANLPSTYI